MTTPLALLPGLLNDRELWCHQIAAFQDRAECFVPDFTTQESVAAMAETVLSAMPARFALTGLSMGGYVAFEILRRAPERIERLALLDTKAGPDDQDMTARRRGLIELAEQSRFQGVTRRLLPLLIAEAHLANETLVAEVMAMATRVGRRAFVRQQTAIMSRPDSRPTLAQIVCPTLVLCGRDDQLTPPELHMEMAAGIRDARLVVVEDCGHLAPLEQPAAVTAALTKWLESE